MVQAIEFNPHEVVMMIGFHVKANLQKKCIVTTVLNNYFQVQNIHYNNFNLTTISYHVRQLLERL